MSNIDENKIKCDKSHWEYTILYCTVNFKEVIILNLFSECKKFDPIFFIILYLKQNYFIYSACSGCLLFNSMLNVSLKVFMHFASWLQFQQPHLFGKDFYKSIKKTSVNFNLAAENNLNEYEFTCQDVWQGIKAEHK